MANTANAAIQNGNNVFASRYQGMSVVATILQSIPFLAGLGLENANKMDKIFGVGSPDAGVAISGAEIPSATMEEIESIGYYSPINQSIPQYDIKNMGLRDTNPTIAVGSGAAGTATIVGGVITSVAVSAPGTGYAGCNPTVFATDIGGGKSAILEATISGGVVTAITVVSGGYGYSGSTAIQIITNNSEGTKYARPTFQWTQRKAVGLIYENDIDRAQTVAKMAEGSKIEAFNRQINNLIQTANKNLAAGLIQQMASDLLFKQPSDTSASATYWDNQYSLKYAIQNTNTYATFDRSLDANFWYRGLYDTDAHAGWSLQSLYNDTMYGKQLMYQGGQSDMGTINFFLVNPTLGAKFNNEQQAYAITANADPNVQILKRQYGFKQQILRYNDVWVITDPRVPVGTVYGINSRSMQFLFRKGFKFTTTQLYKQEGIYGGLDARMFYSNLQYMFVCLAPNLNVQYTNVT